MPLVQAGEIKLNYVEHGSGDNIVIFIHGFLSCARWMDLVWPNLPENLHVFAIDWRGCGDSDKPASTENFANYSLKQHAQDMIAALKSLGIKKCSLATHSTGGVISAYMLLAEPEMFDKVLALDPVSPTGLLLPQEALHTFEPFAASRNYAFKFLSFAASSLFTKESLVPGVKSEFRPETTQEQRELFNLLVDKARELSDGAGTGTLYHLKKERDEGTLHKETHRIKQPMLVLWGEDDLVIPRQDIDTTIKLLPNSTLQTYKGIGHSMVLENPDLYARIFTEYFSK
ncbi:MAG: alpha/beta hydrolase [Syntrophaceae bacterium]|nr:alpha/beta hydrolase [Syntrophaceae bacterium]